MSKKLKETHSKKNEEIDLGSLFDYIEKMFIKIGKLINNFFKFLVWIFNKVFVLVLLIINICFKYYIFIIIAGAIGYLVPHVLSKFHVDTYMSSMLIKQNYATGNLLYANVNRFSEQARQRDSVKLGLELNIPPNLASKIIGFNVVHNQNTNKLVEEYTQYLKTIDSTITVSYDQYIERFDLENISLQTISVTAVDSSVFSHLSKPIIESINTNPYYIEAHNRDINQIKNEISTLEGLVAKTDSLQNQYIDLLNKYYGNNMEDKSSQSTINLNLANNREKISTKEYDLYQKQSSYQLEINDLKNQLEQKKNIVELIKEFNGSTKIESPYRKKKILGSLLCISLVVLFFINKEFGIVNYIKKKGTKQGFFD